MVFIKEMKKEYISSIVRINEGTNEDFLVQWSGMDVYSYPFTSEQMARRLDLDGIKIYAIFLGADIIGTCEIKGISPSSKECFIARYLIDSSYRGKGLGKTALTMIVEHAFDSLGMEKVLLNVFDYNIGGIKCYKNVGFEIIDKIPRGEDLSVYRMEISKQ